MALTNPVRFWRPGRGGRVALGYEATILADICDVVLEARKASLLSGNDLVLAAQCEMLTRAFAKVGIIALVDEATGYQEDRARDALENLLRKFISEELAKWAKTFPDEFYRELFRLKNLRYTEFTTKRPVIIGVLTNNIVYERLAPGVLEELKRITPKDDKGRRKHKYFQRLTEDVGNPKLREHLSNVITLMKASPNWQTFIRLLDRALPKFPKVGTQLPFDLGYDEEIQLD